MYLKILRFLINKLFFPIYNLTLKASKIVSRKGLYELIKGDLFLLKKNNKLPKILFVGSGGTLEMIVRDNLPCILTSIDIDPKRSPDHVMSVCNMSFEDNQFDAVLMFEVLEHVKDPFSAAKEILRVLKLNGILLLSTPFVFGIHDAPNDYWRFTKYGLMNIFKKFNDIEIIERGGFFHTLSTILVRLIICKNPFHKLLGCFFCVISLIILPLLSIIDFLMPRDITLGYYVKAKK